MKLSLSIDELLGYTNEERAKWQQWFVAQPPAAIEAAVQPDGSFPTVWRLMDHIFLVEKRHTQRLKSETPLAQETGVPELNIPALFAFGRAAREELSRFIQTASQVDIGRSVEFRYRDQVLSFTARKLVFHILFHEIRHWAQVAAAVRYAGFPPPGNHDLLFSSALK